jgi:hypothetical protein
MSGLLGSRLRTRLTIFYTSPLVAALLLYAGCVSAFFLDNLRERLDVSLDRDLETVEGSLYLNSDGHLQLSSHEGEAYEDEDEDEDKVDNGYLLEVWSQNGKLLYRSERLGDQALGAGPGAIQGRIQRSARSLRLVSGMKVPTMSRTHRLTGGELVLVRPAVSEGPLWR